MLFLYIVILLYYIYIYLHCIYKYINVLFTGVPVAKFVVRIGVHRCGVFWVAVFGFLICPVGWAARGRLFLVVPISIEPTLVA